MMKRRRRWWRRTLGLHRVNDADVGKRFVLYDVGGEKISLWWNMD
jgi:hypothetical protein